MLWILCSGIALMSILSLPFTLSFGATHGFSYSPSNLLLKLFKISEVEEDKREEEKKEEEEEEKEERRTKKWGRRKEGGRKRREEEKKEEEEKEKDKRKKATERQKYWPIPR